MRLNIFFAKSVKFSDNAWRIVLLVSSILFFGCSDKISIESEMQSEANVIAWTKKEKPLTSFDIQQDDILNILHVQHDVYGLIRQLEKDANPNIQIDWFSADKKLIAKTNSNWNYDEPFPDFFVEPNGERIIEIYAGNRVTVFDSGQNELNSFKIQDITQIAEGHYHTTSSDLELLFSGVRTTIGSRLTLRMIDNNILFDKAYKDWRARAVSISKDKKYFAASIFKQSSPVQFKTLIIDLNGKTVYESPVRTRRIIFDGQGNYAAFLDKNRLELIDLIGMKKLGDYSLDNEEEIIIAADFSKNGILLIQSAKTVRNNKDQFNPWQYVDNELINLNTKAEIIAQNGFKDDWVIKPALWFDENRGQFFYGHNKGFKYINAAN